MKKKQKRNYPINVYGVSKQKDREDARIEEGTGKTQLAKIPVSDLPRLRPEDQNNEMPVNDTDRQNLERQNNDYARKLLEEERMKREMRIQQRIMELE